MYDEEPGARKIKQLEAEVERLSKLRDIYRELTLEDTKTINKLEKRVEYLKKALKAIAAYPHPDFPVGDCEGELDRAERIYMQMQIIADFALNVDDEDG